MSNPSYGPAGQQNAVPTNGTSYPGAAAPQGYGAPAPVVMPKLPGRGGAVTTLVLGVVLMVIIAPVVFFATMIAGVAGTDGNAVKGGTTANGSVVTVTADGVFMVRGDAHKDPSCSLVGADDKSYELEPYAGSEDVYLVEHVPRARTCCSVTASPAVRTSPHSMRRLRSWQRSSQCPSCGAPSSALSA